MASLFLRVFVPSETNPLLAVLLARGVNGESPGRKEKCKVVHKTTKKEKKGIDPQGPFIILQILFIQ